jgi:DNA-binding winged helix-turn-helix (wHTH) protein
LRKKITEGIMNRPGNDAAQLQSGVPGNLKHRAEVMRARSPAAPELLRISFGAFELDEADARLFHHGQPVPLAPKPFAVLCALARTPGMLVTKNALLDAVWGHRFVTESVLKTAISEVRAALGDDPKEPRYIETVSRRGYRFIAMAAGSPSTRRVPVIERNGTGASTHPGLAALTALCRGDAAIGDLIRAVAATLEREQFVLSDR